MQWPGVHDQSSRKYHTTQINQTGKYVGSGLTHSACVIQLTLSGLTGMRVIHSSIRKENFHAYYPIPNQRDRWGMRACIGRHYINQQLSIRMAVVRLVSRCTDQSPKWSYYIYCQCTLHSCRLHISRVHFSRQLQVIACVCISITEK